MTAAPFELERLQRWMQAVVVHHGTVAEALARPAAAGVLPPERLEEVVRPSSSLTAAERLGIYHGMYPLRMEEALAGDYPGLKHFLGDQAFLDLATAYVAAHPSRSFSLNRLGDALPEFVRGRTELKRQGFCYDLARLELAVSQAFDADETPCLGEDAIAAVPEGAWEGARLEPVAAFRLLAFRYPVGAWLDSIDDDEHRHPSTRQRDTWAVVYRRDYSVYRLDLSRPAHDLLADLARGLPLGKAIAAALGREARRRPSQHELFRWFRQWVGAGVFASVSVPALEPSAAD